MKSDNVILGIVIVVVVLFALFITLMFQLGLNNVLGGMLNLDDISTQTIGMGILLIILALMLVHRVNSLSREMDDKKYHVEIARCVNTGGFIILLLSLVMDWNSEKWALHPLLDKSLFVIGCGILSWSCWLSFKADGSKFHKVFVVLWAVLALFQVLTILRTLGVYG